MSLGGLLERLRTARGMRHKEDIRSVYAAWSATASTAPCRNGDDCAALPEGDGYLLFAIEGLLDDFVAREPWFAGYCAVMVNVSDVAAMGGRPLAVVDALWSAGGDRAARIWEGMEAASRAYRVPIVGGHTNLRSEGDHLAVAVLGRAAALLTSFDAVPEDELVAAVDLRGEYFGDYPFWNCSTEAPPERLRADLELLPEIAERGLCRAGKDVSMAGFLGTALMLLETSGIGARIDLERVPKPRSIELERWLASFPSYGFVLSVSSSRVDEVISRFRARGLACAAVGTCTRERRLTLALRGESEVLWDLERAPFTGAGALAGG